MNTVILIGRMTKDAEVSYTQSNTAIARFTLAVDRPAKQGEERQADFPRCVAFGKTADLLSRYCGKGSKLGVEGRLQTGSYQKDGKTYYTTDVIANRIEFLDSKREAVQTDCPSRPAQPSQMDIPSVFEYTDEDIPY